MIILLHNNYFGFIIQHFKFCCETFYEFCSRNIICCFHIKYWYEEIFLHIFFTLKYFLNNVNFILLIRSEKKLEVDQYSWSCFSELSKKVMSTILIQRLWKELFHRGVCWALYIHEKLLGNFWSIRKNCKL